MEKIDQWLAESASEIEKRLQKEFASYILEPEKTLSVKVVREYSDYQFSVFIDDKFACMSRSLNCTSHDSWDHLDIDLLVEEIMLYVRVQRG